jgi:hypothetical protein
VKTTVFAGMFKPIANWHRDRYLKGSSILTFKIEDKSRNYN